MKVILSGDGQSTLLSILYTSIFYYIHAELFRSLSEFVRKKILIVGVTRCGINLFLSVNYIIF